MHFKKWLTERFVEPPKERPDELARKDAMNGRPGAFPVYSLPKPKVRVRDRDRQGSSSS